MGGAELGRAGGTDHIQPGEYLVLAMCAKGGPGQQEGTPILEGALLSGAIRSCCARLSKAQVAMRQVGRSRCLLDLVEMRMRKCGEGKLKNKAGVYTSPARSAFLSLGGLEGTVVRAKVSVWELLSPTVCPVLISSGREEFTPLLCLIFGRCR